MADHIRISRKLFVNPLWTQGRTFSEFEAWIDLLQRAAFHPSKRTMGARAILVEVGQLVAYQSDLAKEWGWSRGKVARFMADLESRETIDIERIGKGMRVSILNFERYQLPGTTPARVRPAAPKKSAPKYEPSQESLDLWEVYQETRVKAGMRGVVKPTDARYKLIERFVEEYGYATVEEAIKGAALSDWHKGTGFYASQGPRFSIEQILNVTSKINQIEVLSQLYQRPPTGTPRGGDSILDAPPMQEKAEPRDGMPLPTGWVWSRKVGGPVPPEDFEPVEAAQ